jgi:hypothetical protein
VLLQAETILYFLQLPLLEAVGPLIQLRQTTSRLVRLAGQVAEARLAVVAVLEQADKEIMAAAL